MGNPNKNQARKIFVTRSLTLEAAELIDKIHKEYNPGNYSKSEIVKYALNRLLEEKKKIRSEG